MLPRLLMSDPESPHEPEHPEEIAPAEAAFDLGEAYDLPLSAAPPPAVRPVRRAPGALRAFLFFTAAMFVGVGIGQSVGVFVAAAILNIPLPLLDPAGMQAGIDRLITQPLGWFCTGFFELLPLLAVTVPFVVGWDRRPFTSIGLQVDAAAGRQFAQGLALGAALMGGIFVIEAAAGWLRVTHVAPLPRLLSRAVVMLLVVLPAAAAEELMLRGYTFQALEEQWGGAAATVITAGAFSSLHLANPNATWASFGGIFVSGVLFGVAYMATRRLWLPIGLHAAWNLFEGPILGFPVSGIQFPSVITTVVHGPALWTGGAFGPEAGLLGILASAAGAVLLARGLPAKARHGGHGDTEGHGGTERPSG
jgi:CAAX protease family protein